MILQIFLPDGATVAGPNGLLMGWCRPGDEVTTVVVTPWVGRSGAHEAEIVGELRPKVQRKAPEKRQDRWLVLQHEGSETRLLQWWQDGVMVQPQAVQVISYAQPHAWLGRPRWTAGSPPNAAPLRWALGKLDAELGRARWEWPQLARCCWLWHQLIRFASAALQRLAETPATRSAVLSQLRAKLQMQLEAKEWSRSFSQSSWLSERDRLSCIFFFLVGCCDAILGFVLMMCVHWHGDHILHSFISLHHWAYDEQLAARLVPWLMGAPADFKLNRELTSFAGSLFLSMFSLWNLHPPAWLLELCFRIFACSCAMMGGSMVVALLMDVLAVASLPLFVAYVGTCLCWKMATRSLYSLCLLFQGWKYNVLRKRVDHHNSLQVDELLIGVILLSIVVFLLPSLFMFYSCLAGCWLLVLAVHGALGLLVMLQNCQPGVLLLLLLLDPLLWHHGFALAALRSRRSAGAETPPQLQLRLTLRPAKLVDALQPMMGHFRKSNDVWGSLKALMGGEIWPLRSYIHGDVRLPDAMSLRQ